MCAAVLRAGVPPLVVSHVPLTLAPSGAASAHWHLHRHDSPSPEPWNVSVERIEFRPVRFDRPSAHNGAVI